MINTITSDTSNSGFIAQVPLDQHPYFTHIEEIKSYGFNQLYTAERFGKKWLLKGLKKEVRQQPLYIEFLKKEFDILMSISYPYIVQAFGVELLPDLGPCIIMEYIDGMTLEELLRREIPLKQKLKIIDQLLEALQYVHQKQIVHRDLKPSNILITHNGGNVKLIDFGLADTDAYRVLKQPAGTLRYMSPEQQEERNPDIRNDIYSVGCIIQEMRLGRSYDKIIRKCISPMEQRFEDVGRLSEAVVHVHKMRNRCATLAVVATFMLFLGYLTWQVRDIQQNMPMRILQQEAAAQSVNESKAVAVEGKTRRTIVFQDSAMVSLAIQKGIAKLDDFLIATHFDEYLNGVDNLVDLDQHRYESVAKHASELIEEYMVGVKAKYNMEESRYIYNEICLHFANQYLIKWDRRLKELVQR